MPLDYEGKEREAYLVNWQDVPRAVAEGELDVKIQGLCERFGFGREELLEEIHRSGIVRALIAKPPNKQNFYEKLAAEFIKSIDGVTDFEHLPNRAWVVSNGSVVKRKELTRLGGASKVKTIDFRWQYGGTTFLASHKYTRGAGGAQDSAYRELQGFIEEASRSVRERTIFVAIADGDYYQGKDVAAGKLRIERLRDLAGAKAIDACTINELEERMKRVLE